MQTANIAKLLLDTSTLRRQWNNFPSGFAYAFVRNVTFQDGRNCPGYFPAAWLTLLSLSWLGVRVIHASRQKRTTQTNMGTHVRLASFSCMAPWYDAGDVNSAARFYLQRNLFAEDLANHWPAESYGLSARIRTLISRAHTVYLSGVRGVCDEPMEPIPSIRQHAHNKSNQRIAQIRGWYPQIASINSSVICFDWLQRKSGDDTQQIGSQR